MLLFLPLSPFQVTRLLTNAGCDLSKVWLGGNSLAEEDHWVWPDGSKVSDATMWGPGQPGRGECMVLVDSKWQAAECLDSRSVKSFLASHQPPKPTRQMSKTSCQVTNALQYLGLIYKNGLTTLHPYALSYPHNTRVDAMDVNILYEQV